MPRRRFYISRDRIRDSGALLPPDQAHHLRDVLRLHAGEEVEVFDGEGAGFLGNIEFLGTEIRIGSLKKIESREAGSGRFVLAAALIKTDRFEWMLQKATELGIDELVPLVTKYSVIRVPAERIPSRLERWHRIVTEASKQCDRLTVPMVHPPVPWHEFLASGVHAGCVKFMLYEKATARIPNALASSGRILLSVGPEGGWDASEARAAELADFQLVRMGTRILRAETAALAAVAIFQHLRE
jgi:16S rRNA (uracil1498-N3)-methyltransferase